MANQPKNHRQPWSSADNAQLRKLAKENTPTRVMGIKLGRTPEAVQNHASQIGQSLRPTNQRPYGTKKR